MSNELNENEQSVRTMVLLRLKKKLEVTQEEIKAEILKMQEALEIEDVEVEKLIRSIEVSLNVRVGGVSGALGDDSDHIEWLPARKTEIDWKYWDRYKHWLLYEKNLPPAVVDDLENTTDSVLGRLESADRKGTWDRRGMVVGHVQSGKTGHYTGLICKAVDAGYRLIIVLAGSDNGLRAQTQLRIDEGFLGFTMGYGSNDQVGKQVGVGLLIEFPFQNYGPHTFTTAKENGDFKKNVAQGLGVLPGGAAPIVLVVKKNTVVLKNLYEWARAVLGSERDGVHKIPNVPILVIDDECDYASVNTKNTRYEFAQKSEQVEPTKINGWIRKILHMFDQSSYVGYTATPFANIFIYHEPGTELKTYGEDLFPRSFIICLPKSSDYMGADKVFGLRQSINRGIDYQEPLPILRPFSDLDTWISPSHEKTWTPTPGPVPESLSNAMLSFVLVCAARRARGQENEHNSMLIHLSRLVDPQTEIIQIIERERDAIKRAIRNSKGETRPIMEKLKQIWETDFTETTASFNDPDLRIISWTEISGHLLAAIEKIEVKGINGKSDDALNYYENQRYGVSVIAIGGAKLSRGLTLEGLTVSYFQRNTKMYDTLMQMGRWFGYRNGYADLCRLYTTDELIRWYGDITEATEELYCQFEEMRITNATPAQFGLKVAQSPENLLVTAKVKMRDTTTLRLSYEGSNPSYRTFRATSIPQCESATRALARWAIQNGSKDLLEDKSHVYKGLSSAGVLEFLQNFFAYPGITTADPKLIAEYIRSCNSVKELESWTVAFVSLDRSSGADMQFEGLPIKLQNRKSKPSGEDRYVGSLWSASDERLGLSEDELNKAKWKNSSEIDNLNSGAMFRMGRDISHGLLAIYFIDTKSMFTAADDQGHFDQIPFIPTFAFSFPASESAPGIDYVVRNSYWQQEEDDEDEI
jgi:hypothetical protein